MPDEFNDLFKKFFDENHNGPEEERQALDQVLFSLQMDTS